MDPEPEMPESKEPTNDPPLEKRVDQTESKLTELDTRVTSLEGSDAPVSEKPTESNTLWQFL